MSTLDNILMGMVADHINFGQDKESDEMFRDDLKQAKKEINTLIIKELKELKKHMVSTSPFISEVLDPRIEELEGKL
jgi:hypothetical protein